MESVELIDKTAASGHLPDRYLLAHRVEKDEFTWDLNVTGRFKMFSAK